jgi:hypothetical protein
MNNTFTNLNKKETMTGDIPKCSLFDKYKEQKIKSIEISDEIKRLTSNKKLTTPVRIQSANLNKKEALNTILNTKFSIKTDTSISNKNSDFNFDKVNLTSVDEIKNKNNLMKENSENKFLKKIDDSSPQEGQMKNHEEKIKELSNQLKVYEDEIKRLKELHLKTEEKNLSMIKQLEEEIKQLKIQKFAQKTDNIHSVDNSINNIGNINFNVTNEDKVSSKSVLNNKRNWMDDDLAQGIFIFLH